MIKLLRDTQNYKKLSTALKQGDELPWLRGLPNASTAYLLAALIDDFPRKSFLIVLPSQQEAEQVHAEILAYLAQSTPNTEASSDNSFYHDKNDITLFPGWKSQLFDGIAPSKIRAAQRIQTLQNLLQSPGRSIVLTTSRALAYKLPSHATFSTAFCKLQIGDEVEQDDVREMLLRGDYKPVELVEVKGEFACRGDILDVYPLTADTPVRIEFFGDEIDAIRAFHPTSQRSTKQFDAIVIPPMREVVMADVSLEHWQAQTEKIIQEYATPKLINCLHELTQRLKDATRKPTMSQTHPAKLLREKGQILDGIEGFLPMLLPQTEQLIDYFPDDTCVVLIEPQWQKREVVQIFEQVQQLFENKMEASTFMVPPDKLLVSFEELQARLERYPVICSSLATPRDISNSLRISEAAELDFDMKSLGLPPGNYQMVISHMKTWGEKGYRVYVFCETPQQAKRVSEILTERALNLTPQDNSVASILPGSPKAHLISNASNRFNQHVVTVGKITEGFLNESLKLVVISEEEIFGNRQQRQIRHKRPQHGPPVLSLIDLKVGDSVVHISHGIAIYEGIRRLDFGGKFQDFLVLKYSHEDILYVPTYQVDLIQKYIGSKEETYKPRLDRLGGPAWRRRKNKAKASIEKMADELLKLYAARQARNGYSFPKDVPWQPEFEALFPYRETDDQFQAIEDVKADMESARPMDRLICADVGYGKTEVALRATFKAVMVGKQVAVLVPTTILALQHYDTFEKRFEPFPVHVEMLNRFRTQKEIRQVKTGLSEGTVDIVIGTHSLLSKSVKFSNLGLLIVDEEHRFGVKHKEKVKQFKETIDVLTLTATPIPRTLHMSLVGIRDFSVINTPPENRLPIQTYVMPYNSDVVRAAILKELSRSGQVFFVYNRVQSILNMAKKLQQLVPDARIAVAHGQMPERELETIMLEFVRHKHDVLVCTMIIESGLDIPNVNTILINRADALGLAQLYQLRGRVGRADEQAYGYMFYPENQVITEDAQKRLRVIEEFTELGSGFKIALRDLEIRGTGNILGAEQHGHIVTIGYELYCKLLEEAVQKLKGETVEEDVEMRINLPVEAYLPDDYVPDSRQKVSVYRKIAALKSEEALQELRKELKDRYGMIPKPAEMLLAVASLKQLCQKLSITAIVAGKSSIKITFDEQKPRINIERLIEGVRKDEKLRLLPPAQLMFKLPDEITGEEMLAELKQTLTQFVNA